MTLNLFKGYWADSTHTQSHTHEHGPGVGWCCQWGRVDSPDLWSRASALQPQSPCQTSAQRGGPLLQASDTVPHIINTPRWGEGFYSMMAPHTKTHRPTSLKSVPQVVDFRLRPRNPKYPFMVETWRTDSLFKTMSMIFSCINPQMSTCWFTLLSILNTHHWGWWS